MNFKHTILYKNFITHKRIQFILNIPAKSYLLDIGCGNHSPSFYHQLNPDLDYYGVDIQEYNLDSNDYQFAKKIYFFNENKFANEIAAIPHAFDFVISAHNIEHTSKPLEVIDAMMSRLKIGGKLYLSFPTEKSINFPKRKGTLNFYDDETHQNLPNANLLLEKIKNNKGEIVYFKKQYRNFYGFIKGLIQEPISIILNKKLSHTWHVWGFETIIIAEKK